MKKNRIALPGLVLCAVLAFSFPARAEGWALSDDGKYWMYFYSPAESAEDEWIESEGKEYYVDSSGHMKTGWVTDKNSGERYYLGSDGAKLYNAFTGDGKYVGSEGTEVKAFDSYRKAAKKEIKQIFSELKKNGQEYAWIVSDDLNRDGYRDLAVSAVNPLNAGVPGHLLAVYIWDSEGQELNVSFETEVAAGSEKARLLRGKEDGTLCLVIQTDSPGFLYFDMEDDATFFENENNFSMEISEWGTPVFLNNKDEMERLEWLAAIKERQDSLVDEITLSYVLCDQNGSDGLIDRGLTEEETELWEDE